GLSVAVIPVTFTSATIALHLRRHVERLQVEQDIAWLHSNWRKPSDVDGRGTAVSRAVDDVHVDIQAVVGERLIERARELDKDALVRLLVVHAPDWRPEASYQ